MAFALVNFYEEDLCDVIQSSDIILEEKDKVKETIEGLKTLVQWRDVKSKGKSTKVPAEIIKISDDKNYLLKLMKGEDGSPINKGKGCRKRILNAKYVEESDAKEEHEAAVKSKQRKMVSKKSEEARRSETLAKLIKEKYNKESMQNDSDSDNESENNYKNIIETLKIQVNTLQQQNEQLRDQIASSDDLRNSLKKLKRYVNKLEGSPTSSTSGRSSPSSWLCGSSSSASSMALHSPGSPQVHMVSETTSPHTAPNPQSVPLALNNKDTHSCETSTTDMIALGPGLALSRTIFKRFKPKKVGPYVANIMGATLSREHMATHSYKGQKGKNGFVKPKLDPIYTKSLIEHAVNIKYMDLARPVIEEDIVKAIKFKLNNEEQAWKKQQGGNAHETKNKNDNTDARDDLKE